MTTSRWSSSRCSKMFLLRLVALRVVPGGGRLAAWPNGAGGVCHLHEPWQSRLVRGLRDPDAIATMIFLHGPGPSDIALGRLQAHFFAEHGFRVLLPDYLSVTHPSKPPPQTIGVGPRWSEDIVADLRSRPIPRTENCPCRAGSGASVALVAASQKIGVDAVAEWSGRAPQRILFPGAKPAPASHPSRRAG